MAKSALSVSRLGKLVVDPPLAEPLSRGVAFINYRTENLQVVPAFGPQALAITSLDHKIKNLDCKIWPHQIGISRSDRISYPAREVLFID